MCKKRRLVIFTYMLVVMNGFYRQLYFLAVLLSVVMISGVIGTIILSITVILVAILVFVQF